MATSSSGRSGSSSSGRSGSSSSGSSGSSSGRSGSSSSGRSGSSSSGRSGSSSGSSGSSSSGSSGSSSSRSSGSSSSRSSGSSTFSSTRAPTVTRTSSGGTISDYGGGGRVYSNASDNPSFKSSSSSTPSPSRKEKNPVTSSTSPRAERSSLERGIKDLRSSYNSERALMQEQQQALADRRTQTIGDLKSEYDISSQQQQLGQASDYAARSTNLITSGGGFLGATQSQEGVLQNLKGTFDAERTALFAKREAAINAANIAYEDKDFALAREMSKNATDLQKEIYKRQTDFSDQQLKIAAGNRAQTEFDIGLTDKKVAEYSLMDDASFATVDPDTISAIDTKYYPGYTARARELAQQARDVKTKADASKFDLDILDARSKITYGQSFSIAGQTYTGIKVEKPSDESVTANTRKQINEFFSPGYVIPGTNIGTLGQDGYANPDAWKLMYKTSNLDRTEYIKQYGYLVNPSTIGNYGLSPKEQSLINNTLSAGDEALVAALKGR